MSRNIPKLVQARMGRYEDAAELVTKLLDAKHEGADSREEHLWNKFLHEDDQRIALAAFTLMLHYKYGKPVEKKEVTVEDGSFVAEVPPKMADDEWSARYAGKPPERRDS